jgi:hypothetical protein
VFTVPFSKVKTKAASPSKLAVPLVTFAFVGTKAIPSAVISEVKFAASSSEEQVDSNNDTMERNIKMGFMIGYIKIVKILILVQ